MTINTSSNAPEKKSRSHLTPELIAEIATSLKVATIVKELSTLEHSELVARLKANEQNEHIQNNEEIQAKILLVILNYQPRTERSGDHEARMTQVVENQQEALDDWLLKQTRITGQKITNVVRTASQNNSYNIAKIATRAQYIGNTLRRQRKI